MSLPATAPEQRSELWNQYRSNLPRHLIGLSRHMQTELMQALEATGSHPHLRLNYEPFITLVGREGARLTELADVLAVSKQAVNQAANQVEAAGYIQRMPDPSDGRAKLVQLTNLGHQLMKDGGELIKTVMAEYADHLGTPQLQEFSQLMGSLHTGLALRRLRVRTVVVDNTLLLGALLPRIADHVMQRLMELTRARGHPGLKMSFQQVLILLGPQGGRIQEMARAQAVSKQAIGAIVGELETLGYIERLPAPGDARQVVVSLTPAGVQLMEHSAASVLELEREFAAILGTDGLAKLKEYAADLYDSLHLEEDVLGPVPNRADDLPALARRLKRQLGEQGALRLSKLLSAHNEVE